MSMKTEAYDDFTVFSRLAEGRLSAEEFEHVEDRLMTDAGFRRRYVRFMDMDFELSQRLDQKVPDSVSPPAPAIVRLPPARRVESLLPVNQAESSHAHRDQ